MKCALCQNEEFETVSKVDAKSSDKLIASLCNKCGLIQQNPIPTADELKVYYSDKYRVGYKKSYTPKPKHVFRAAMTALQRIEFLRKSNITKGSLLDVGAGGGEFTYLSGKIGFEVEGIEPNIGYSEYAKNEYGCNVVTGEIEDINGKYDVITLFHVLEHLPSPVRAFEKLYNLLNSNGILFVEVPWIETNNASPHNIYFKAHIFYFSVDTLISCASQYFDVVKVETTSNLRVLFIAKTIPAGLELPRSSSVEAIKERLKIKGWFEYLFIGKGILKPISKVVNVFKENRVTHLSGKKIIDNIVLKNWNC
jgi:2-polyprenyl-3-methyl-5-hydroxy-6-metoxy-1,4-benzoquinol methylase